MRRAKTLEEMAMEAYEYFDTHSPVPTGFRKIDEAIGGMYPRYLTCLVAGTGVGKSSLAMLSAMQSGQKIGVISLEDDELFVGPRSAAPYSKVDAMEVWAKGKELEEAKKGKFRSAIRSLRNHSALYHTPGLSMKEVLECVDDLAESGCKWIWLDYIQLVGQEMDAGRAAMEVGKNSNKFLARCKKHGVCGGILSQTSKTARAAGIEGLDAAHGGGILANISKLGLYAFTDKADNNRVRVRVEKCSVGKKKGMEMVYQRTEYGTLEEIDIPEVDF